MKERRLLIVDDDPDARTLLRQALRDEPFAFLEAGNAADALSALESHPDLVVLDIGLPDRSGLDLLLDIRALHSFTELPVVIYSGQGDSLSVVEAFNRGANDYITKPIDPPVAAARIRSRIRPASVPSRPPPVVQESRAAGTADAPADGAEVDVCYLYIRLLLPPLLVAARSGTEVREITGSVFELATHTAKRYGGSVWSRMEEGMLLAYLSTDPGGAVLTAMELQSALLVLNMIRDYQNAVIRAGMGIDSDRTRYQTDRTSIYSRALNNAAHLAVLPAAVDGVAMPLELSQKLSPRFQAYFVEAKGTDEADLATYRSPL